MKTLVKALLAVIFTAKVASAQNSMLTMIKPINCYADITAYQSMLVESYDEKPLFVGTSVIDMITPSGEPMQIIGVFNLYTNQSTGTFTSLVVFTDGSGCELDVGENFTPVVN
jgi:hypothetical protein